MKVLAVASSGDLGGSQLSLATFLEHRPANVQAGVLMVSDGPLRRHLAERQITTWVASGFEGRPDIRRLIRFTRSLEQLVATIRPDVVWAIGQKAALLSLPACRIRGVPIVWHKVDFSWDRLLAKPLAIGVNGVVAPSHAVVRALGPLRGRRVLSIIGLALGLGDDVEARPDPTRPTIGTLARLVPYKGHHHIIRAGALLLDEFPALRVVLAGSEAPEYPHYLPSLKALSAELGMEGRVELPGFVTDVREVLERLTVFVNATYRDEEGFGLEGLGGAMLEASWAGVPIVATTGGGTDEGMNGGRTGTLVEAADPALLAEAIAPYLRQPELAARVGAAGKRFARRRFAPDVTSRRLFEVLGSVADTD